jgi:hypothetical protein
MSNFVPTTNGITIWRSSNKLDVVIEGPGFPHKPRCTLVFGGANSELELDGKPFELKGIRTDDDGAIRGFEIEWGGRTLNPGLRTKARGVPSFYCSLDHPSASVGPQTAEELLDALAGYIK